MEWAFIAVLSATTRSNNGHYYYTMLLLLIARIRHHKTSRSPDTVAPKEKPNVFLTRQEKPPQGGPDLLGQASLVNNKRLSCGQLYEKYLVW